MKPIRPLVENQDVVVVDVAASVAQAARLMSERQVGAVPVLDGERVVGIFTERDVLSRVVAAGVEPARTPVSSVMSTNLVVADIADNHEICLRRMQQAHVRHLLVLKEGRLAGILSMRDLLALEIDERDEAIHLLNAYVHYIPVDLSPSRSGS
ncbi:MAG: CBS domain-containing protein [Acidobacteria bacterium]|nr:CBS domain-containing protein [Acidobacteriota bacterium]